MLRVTGINLPVGHSDADLRAALAERLGVEAAAINDYRVRRKSVDARKKRALLFTYTLDVEIAATPTILERPGVSVAEERRYVPPLLRQSNGVSTGPCVRPQDAGGDACATNEMQAGTPALRTGRALPGSAAVSAASGAETREPTRPKPLTFPTPPAQPESPPVVVGTGPCGLFAALLLAELGLEPLVFERGKPAIARGKDVYHFWKTGVLEPNSNALFGEGGAGTFSDGKLTTQIKDRGNRIQKVIEELVAAGAPEEIRYLNKPHIGTDRLVGVVGALRARIESLGGQVFFESQVTGLHVEAATVRGIEVNGEAPRPARQVIFAIGHSARDTFDMLYGAGATFEPKPFSIGVRIEHPQAMIDRQQYGDFAGHPELGAADYKLVYHGKDKRSVYTFCMCPGGEVICASSAPGQLVTNGMSQYQRKRRNANSGLLVSVRVEDFEGEHPLAGVAFQRRFEEAAFALGGGGYAAPVQLAGDFLAGTPSKTLGDVEPSYRPGYRLTSIEGCLPPFAVAAIREALPMLDRKLRGFARPDAVMTGVETRSSSPIRMTRDETGQSVGLRGLYPAGEGAGYAGGIMSAAVDGLRAAEAVVKQLSNSD